VDFARYRHAAIAIDIEGQEWGLYQWRLLIFWFYSIPPVGG